MNKPNEGEEGSDGGGRVDVIRDSGETPDGTAMDGNYKLVS